MASIIKVDTIQTVAGNAPTAADLGFNTTGSVLQVVSAQYDTENLVASDSFVDYMTLDITPSSTSSKIYLIHNIHYAGFGSVRIQRRPSIGSTVAVLNPGTDFALYMGNPSTIPNSTDPASSGYRLTGSFHLIDEPGTTSTVTYACQVESHLANSFNIEINPNGIYSTSGANQAATQLILMEIAG